MAGIIFEWVGTGSAFNPTLGNTGFLVHGPETDRVLLVDCGTLTPSRLLESGWIDRVTDIALTHAHADHIGGIESFSLYRYFVKGDRNGQCRHLHLASDAFAHSLWEHSLKGGMGVIQDAERRVFDATLSSYFQVSVSQEVRIPGLPAFRFVPTPHVAAMPNWALRFENGVYYSGDTVEPPPLDADLIFQDCQFNEDTPSAVHITYRELKEALPPAVRARTHLVHLSEAYRDHDAKADGFGGFVMPGQRFEV
jgi:ribonuclease BN (tRNA processing enzyme)